MSRVDIYTGSVVTDVRQICHSTTIHVYGDGRVCIDLRFWERSIFKSGRTRGRVKGKVFRAVAVL